jgi:peptidoglycan/xylan/chitin deacetylase (PgdA/CDA1 family)
MLILCYHDLCEIERNRWTLAPGTFSEHLTILAERGYRVMRLDDWHTDCFWKVRTIVLSFDDGRLGSLDALPILATLQMPATFYVCPGFVNGTAVPAAESYSAFMNWNAIRSLARAGHTIGSHAMTHHSLLGRQVREQCDELAQSRQMIEEQIGRQCLHFAAPYGDLDSSLSDLVAAAGYLTAASTVFGVNRNLSSRYGLKRWEVRSPCPRDEFERRLTELEGD